MSQFARAAWPRSACRPNESTIVREAATGRPPDAPDYGREHAL